VLEKFKIYQAYIDNFGNSTTLIKQKIATSPEFAAFIKKQTRVSRQLQLEDFLIMPVQRLPRYVLLLKEIAKHTEPGHPDEEHLKTVLDKLQEILSFLNNSKKKVDHLEKISSIVQSVVDVDQSTIIERQFIFDGPLITYGARDDPNRNEGLSFMDKLWSLVGKEEIYVYLFEDMMLCAKKIGKTTDSKNAFAAKLMAYKYNVMKIVPIFGNNCAYPVKGEDVAFRVDTDPEHVYTCPSLELRDKWVSKINNRNVKVV